MTLTKMFNGDLRVLASDAVQMAENAYKKGQTDEREACAKVADLVAREIDDTNGTATYIAAAIRAREQA